MSWSVRVARIAGIDLKIHLTFLLLLAWIGVAYYVQGGLSAALEGIVFILLLFLCVVLHEFGHALAARRFGIATPDITLLPIGGMARLQRMPERPGQELVVALAGPAVNVAIALVLGLFLGRLTGVQIASELDDPQVGLLAKLVSINVILAVFNLIPAFPMDGGRVLRALLSMRMDRAEATRIAGGIGQGVALLFGFLGLLFNPLLIFIALFVYVGAAQEIGWSQLRMLSEGVPVHEAMVRDVTTLPLDATLDDAVDALLATSHQEFPLVDEVGRVHGLLTRDRLVRGLREEGPEAAAYRHMHRDLPSIGDHESAARAFEMIQQDQVPALPVVDDTGRLVGLVTRENVGELMMVRSAIRRRERSA